MQLNSVLTILDKPKHEQTAYALARKIQEGAGCHLNLAAFFCQPAVASSDVFDTHQRRTLRQEILLERKQWQRALVQDSGAAAKDVSLKTVWTDDIAAWVRKELEKEPSDLVIKSVHQSKQMMHTPLDWELLSTCQAPLLLASTRKRKRSRRVLAAIDLRHTDRTHQRLNRKVLASAARFAELYDAELHCVSALEISKVLRDLDVIDERKTKKRMLERSEDLLNDLLSPYKVKKANRHFPVGKVGQVVAQTAGKLKSDLLVVGSFSHRIKELVGLGNSAEKILARATCDVLAVHP